MRILTVCLGNVCRSPVAERLLRARLAAAGLTEAYDVASAGLTALVGRPLEPSAADQLTRLGGDPAGFAAQQLRPAYVEEADLVLTATADVRRRVLEEVPGALRRTFTLRELAALVSDADPGRRGLPDLVADAARRRGSVGHRDLDIPDPMGRGEAEHAYAADLAAEAVDVIVAALRE